MKGKRELFAKALNTVARAPLRRLLERPGLTCLTYHRVTERDALDEELISASLADFEWQLAWLKKNLRVVGGDEVLSIVRGDLQLREPTVCITFDDGYADNYVAGRVLAERFGLPAIFFVTTGFVGTSTVPHWDRMAFAVKRT